VWVVFSTGIPGITIWQSVQLATLEIGNAFPFGNNHAFQWTKIPEVLKGSIYAQPLPMSGSTRFSVTEPTQIVVAFLVNEWHDGGSGGPWQQELITREELERDWSYVGVLESAPLTWEVYSRECQPGEAFVLRTHKYHPPLLIAPDRLPRQTAHEQP
jgi:hypothetical protein